ncbi:MAG: hypothetical protein AAF721_17745 [Myxococcota bacterium]
MSRQRFILPLAIGTSLYTLAGVAAAAQPSGQGVVQLRPSLVGVGAATLVGHGGVAPNVRRAPTADHARLIIEDSLGNVASLKAESGTFWAEASPSEIDAILAVVDTELDEILVNYDAALDLGVDDPDAPVLNDLDSPLCQGCVGLGSDVQHENQAVVALLENLYVQQLPSVDVAYDFTRHLDYDLGELFDFLGALQGMLDYATYSQMLGVSGTYPIMEVTQDGVTTTAYNVDAGDPRSGAVWESETDVTGFVWQHQVHDNDIDNDGIPNGEDNDMDGDSWPDWLDRDRDGDGTINSQDSDPDNPHEECYPKQRIAEPGRLGGMTGYGSWFPVTSQNYVEDVAALTEWELANFLASEPARVLIDGHARGDFGMAELLSELDLAYLDATAGMHPVLSSATLYAAP